MYIQSSFLQDAVKHLGTKYFRNIFYDNNVLVFVFLLFQSLYTTYSKILKHYKVQQFKFKIEIEYHLRWFDHD